MRRSVVPILALLGCYEPPEFPLLDEIPIVAQKDVCDAPRDERVGCVIDGDTFDLGGCGEEEERVRLLGVAAPEIAGGGSGDGECWGEVAHEALDVLVAGEEVTLTFDVDCAGIYDRTLAYAWIVGDDLDDLDDLDDPAVEDLLGTLDGEPALLVNEWLVDRGHARVFEPEIFGELIWQERLDAAERRAQRANRGLWGACGPGPG